MTTDLVPSSARAHALVGAALAAAALGTLLAGRAAVSAFVCLVVGAAYVDLRRLLAPPGHPLTFLVGGAGTAAFLWTGYASRLDGLAWVGAGLLLALLLAHVVLNELGATSGAVEDVAATLAAATICGALGAHVLLIRAVPGVGFRGLLVFGLVTLGGDAAAFAVGRSWGRRALSPRISPRKTWEGTLAGAAASLAAGLVAGFVLRPPFSPLSGLVFGLGAGVLTPLGDLVFSALKRGAKAKQSGSYLGPLGGALDAVDGVLFVAPAFYWALRTIAL